MSALPSEMMRDIYRRDFLAFAHRAFTVLYPGKKLKINWHLELVCDQLLSGNQRQIFNLPPRSLKSFLISVVYPAWVLGHEPSTQIMCVSYGQEPADKFARETRKLMGSDFYKAVFETNLSPDRSAAHDFETTAGGCRLATSVGGAITSRGADLIIVDDPMKAAEGLSPAHRNAANDFFDSSIITRLNDLSTGRIIIAMQRLHVGDLTAHVQNTGQWRVISLPAIADRDYEFAFDTPYGRQRVLWAAGTALHPERASLEELEAIRLQQGEYVFVSQYLQMPVPPGGNLIKSNWIRKIPRESFPKKFIRIIQAWDTALEITRKSAYSACTTWGVTDDHVYLLDVARAKMPFPDLKEAAIKLAQRFKPDEILIENQVSGISLAQELSRKCIYSVKPVKIAGGKELRLFAQSAKFFEHFVVLPEAAPWLEDYVAELTAFPSSEHCDQVDSTTLALERISALRERPAFTEYLQELDRKLLEEKPAVFHMRAPPGVNITDIRTCHPKTGEFRVRTVLIGPDGLFLLTEEEARLLRRAGWVDVNE